MNFVFLNTFERQLGDSRVRCAYLSICEREGIWAVQWTEEEDMQQKPVETWYEGPSWEEMLMAFRHGVAGRMVQGYTPVIDGMLDERRAYAGSKVSLLQCYGEMHADKELFDELREWRRARAAAEKKSAYLIANNRMLWMISAFVPHTAEELMQIPGWGEAKQSAYGAEVLKLTVKYEQRKPFPLDWVADEIDADTLSAWRYRQKQSKFKQQMDRHQEKRRILEGIREGSTLDELAAKLDIPRRELMERIEQLEREGYDLESLVARELAGMPEEEQRQVWEALGSIGDRYLKPVLHRVYGEEGAAGKPLDIMYDRLRLIRIRFRREGKEEAI